MQINTKAGKTEAMAFTPTSVTGSGKAATTLFPPLDLGGTPIHWTQTYKYLGLPLHHDLSTAGFISSKVGAMWDTYFRLFVRNPFVRASPIGAQSQLRDGELQGTLTYFLSLIKMTERDLASIDAVLLQTSRICLGGHKRTAIAALLSGMRTCRATHIAAREKERLFLTLSHGPLRSSPPSEWPPALHLFDALKNEPRSTATTTGPLHNWAHVALDERAAAFTRGAIAITPSQTCPISTCAHVFWRSLAYADLKRSLGATPHGAHSIPPTAPPTRGSLTHLKTLSFHMLHEPEDLGHNHGYTRLSCIGPATCSGSIAALATATRTPALLSARMGDECLHSWPFTKRRERPNALREEDGPAIPFTVRFDERPCPLCKGGTESLYHLVNNCPHPAMQRNRTSLWASAAKFLTSLLSQASSLVTQTANLRTRLGHPPPANGPSGVAIEAARRLLATSKPPPATPETNFLLYWTLMATPWPERVAGSDQPTARIFGSLFDHIELPNSRIRSLANNWAAWAEKEIIATANARTVALNAMSTVH